MSTDLSSLQTIDYSLQKFIDYICSGINGWTKQCLAQQNKLL